MILFNACFSDGWLIKLVNALHRVTSKTLEFALTLGDKPITVSFFPERDSALTVARNLCISRASEYQFTEANIMERCINPVAEATRSQIKRWVESKRLDVPIKVGESEVTLSFFPERETTVSVARNFCVSNANTLNLTEGNVISDCLAPVNKILREAAVQWVNVGRPRPQAAEGGSTMQPITELPADQTQQQR